MKLHLDISQINNQPYPTRRYSLMTGDYDTQKPFNIRSMCNQYLNDNPDNTTWVRNDGNNVYKESTPPIDKTIDKKRLSELESDAVIVAIGASDYVRASIASFLNTIADIKPLNNHGPLNDMIDIYQWYFLRGSFIQYWLSSNETKTISMSTSEISTQMISMSTTRTQKPMQTPTTPTSMHKSMPTPTTPTTSMNRSNRICKAMDVGVILYHDKYNTSNHLELNTYITMEAFKCDIHTFLSQHPSCSCCIKIKICKEILECIKQLLDFNMLHLDLKLENFVIKYEQKETIDIESIQVAIIDFESVKINTASICTDETSTYKKYGNKKIRLMHSPMQMMFTNPRHEHTYKQPDDNFKPPECIPCFANFSEQSTSWVMYTIIQNIFGRGFVSDHNRSYWSTNNEIQYFLKCIEDCSNDDPHVRPSVSTIIEIFNECFV